jgi:hypothetical protein
MMKTLLLTVPLLTFLAACEHEEVEPAKWSVLVTVVDQLGQPLSPEDIFWYLPPGTDDTHTETALTCVNEDCTEFGIPLDVTGDIYVAATYHEDIPGDDYCWYQGYDGAPITITVPEDATTRTTLEITLELDTDQMVCE